MNLLFLFKHRSTFLYGISLFLLLFLLKWLELRLVIIRHAFEVYAGAIAVLFTALGVWLALKIARPKVHTVIVEKELYVNPASDFTFNEKVVSELQISKRELEVLQLMAEGLSNQEIASQMCLSLNTIKTHSSRIFEKLDVKRRTQAIDKGKRIGIIP